MLKKYLVISIIFFSFILFAQDFGYTEDQLLNYYNEIDIDYFHYENYYADCKELESEDEIKFRLKVLIDKQDYLGYTEARYQMFTYIDNYDGWVDCFYTKDRLKCNSIPNGTVMNCEHLFPQSWFFGSEKSKMKTDLHHLRPTQSRANSIRSNYTFGIVDHDIKHDLDGSKLGKDKNGYTVFEPVDRSKGDVARSLFYFSIRYGWDIPSYLESILREWNETDPVDEIEFNRNSRVDDVQGNRNPFIDEPELVNKISNF